VTGVKQVVGAYGRRRNIGAGDYVPRGAVLAQIRHQDLKNQLDQAEAAVSQAQAQHIEASQNYDRAKALYATRSLTKPEFDQAQARFDSTLGAVDQAKANLHQAQLTLADADLTAPFSGYILARNIELGNLAAPGTVAFTIADTSAVKIGFGVPEYAVRQLRLAKNSQSTCKMIRKSTKDESRALPPAPNEKNRSFRDLK
jgi:RND family efflux transporter, MFP subunit